MTEMLRRGIMRNLKPIRKVLPAGTMVYWLSMDKWLPGRIVKVATNGLVLYWVKDKETQHVYGADRFHVRERK